MSMQTCNIIYIYLISLIDHHVIKNLISCFSLSYGNEHNQQKACSLYETAVASLSFQKACHTFTEIYF